MRAAEFPDTLADVLAGIQRQIRRTLRRGTPAPALRGAQVELLRLVEESPGIGVSEAARQLGLAGNSVSTLVNQLTGSGLLRRETAPGDRRSARLMPTPQARARLRDWHERRGALVREQVTRLSDEDQAALAAALPALRRLSAGLHEDLEER
ncbi:MarR family winged helix-turn-helix transcriptional regulator [Streptomyces sp. NPDC020917]|uniref:MarR family winged helix-turn-helix transcriptional regulator n=1 Tax=Streptomyces sp. NPDC020917 TaxID=3365102 RepID=UPI00378A9B21